MSEEELSNLTVAVRIRPLNAEERSKGATQIAYKVDDQMVVLMDPGDRWDEFLRNKRVREKKYLFDAAFGPSAAQDEVYQKTTKSLIDSVMNGFNATVFAYGATGAGKTYTMLGTGENPGIMARALDELFRRMDSGNREHTYDVTMSYLEIYNEMIRDLLHPSSGILDLREDSRGAILVAGLSETQAKSSREVLQLLMQGNRRRTQEPTAANKTSSRSHAVLQVSVTQKNRIRDVKDKIRIGKLFLIDLAGSERASRTKNRGKRMKEGAHINRSLLALGNVINTLTEKGSKYVNYRDSKLTRILKDSLGGNSKTVMIAHISPAAWHFEETRNTLTYADRAKNITTKMMANSQEVTHHVMQYQTIIAELRKEISRLKSKIDSQQHIRSPSPNKNYPRSESALSLIDRDNLGARLDTVLSGDDLPVKQRSDVSFTTTIREINEDHTAEFLKLRSELVATFQNQVKLRHNLMELNDQAYEAALVLSSKSTVLKAWDKKEKESGEEFAEKEPDSIKKLRVDVEKLEEKLETLSQKKSKVEWDLAVCHKKADKLEQTLPDKASNSEQREMLAVLSRLHEVEVENALILNRRLERQETSLKKVKNYHSVCDELISEQNNLIKGSDVQVPDNVTTLNNSYKAIRNQAHYHMLPMNDKATELSNKSWNRSIMEKERAKSNEQKLSKTMNYAELQRLKTEMETANKAQQNEYRKENSNASSTVKLPPIHPVEVKYTTSTRSKDDSNVKYELGEIHRDFSLENIRSKAKARKDSSATGSDDSPNRPVTASSKPRSRSRSADEPQDSIPVSKKLSRPNSDNDLSRNRKSKNSRSRNPPNRRVRSPTRPHLPVIINR